MVIVTPKAQYPLFGEYNLHRIRISNRNLEAPEHGGDCDAWPS